MSNSALVKVRHRKGYGVYAKNDRLPPHKAVASWYSNVTGSHCICGYPVSETWKRPKGNR